MSGPAILNRNGQVRRPAPRRLGYLWQNEIEPGRTVPSDWNKELFESWADRKARRAREGAR